MWWGCAGLGRGLYIPPSSPSFFLPPSLYPFPSPPHSPDPTFPLSIKCLFSLSCTHPLSPHSHLLLHALLVYHPSSHMALLVPLILPFLFAMTLEVISYCILTSPSITPDAICGGSRPYTYMQGLYGLFFKGKKRKAEAVWERVTVPMAADVCHPKPLLLFHTSS